MNSVKKLSVIIPTHHRPEMLMRCLEALKMQVIAPSLFEVIVVPSPNDIAVECLKAYATNFELRVVRPESDPHQGRNVSFKRNLGAEQARASWLAYTDDDCAPSPHWLSSVLPHLENPEVGAIEGKTLTPTDAPRTLTWKGMQRMAKAGGYQTCNMFYRKSVFTEAGGFDSIHFPWYLEDTDLAWSILGQGHTIVWEPEAVVIHPVGPGATWRLTHEARNTGLKLRLLQKHPKIYRSKKMKALRFSHYLYLFLELSLVFNLISLCLSGAVISLVFILIVIAAHMFKLFRGLNTNLWEIIDVALRTLSFPPIALVSLIRERLRPQRS